MIILDTCIQNLKSLRQMKRNKFAMRAKSRSKSRSRSPPIRVQVRARSPIRSPKSKKLFLKRPEKEELKRSMNLLQAYDQFRSFMKLNSREIRDSGLLWHIKEIQTVQRRRKIQM